MDKREYLKGSIRRISFLFHYDNQLLQMKYYEGLPCRTKQTFTSQCESLNKASVKNLIFKPGGAGSSLNQSKQIDVNERNLQNIYADELTPSTVVTAVTLLSNLHSMFSNSLGNVLWREKENNR